MAILTPSAAAIAEAGRHLRAGGLVGVPTETVYGLAGDATSDRAVAHIFDLKGRPRFNPLIVHVETLAAAERLAIFDRGARFLAQRRWPGPLTLILPRRAEAPISLLATAGLDTVAIRVPDHPVALQLIAAAGRPLAIPSANPSGAVSPTTAAHVETGFGGRLAMVLDGGACPVGVESTVLDLTGPRPRLLRPGGASLDQLVAAIGEIDVPTDDPARPRAPGQLASHYAPSLPVILDPPAPLPGMALLAFGDKERAAGWAEIVNLSPTGDLRAAAAELFAALRDLDDPARFSAIGVESVPDQGLGLAINDRLRRAAAPRGDGR